MGELIKAKLGQAYRVAPQRTNETIPCIFSKGKLVGKEIYLNTIALLSKYIPNFTYFLRKPTITTLECAFSTVPDVVNERYYFVDFVSWKVLPRIFECCHGFG